MPVSRLRSGLIAAFATIGMAGGALAGPLPPDQFPLGESARSGAVCQAVRNDDDPAVQKRGARAWEVRCRGWDGALGRLYLYNYRGAADVGPNGAWTKALADHATCAGASPAPVKDLKAAQREECKAFTARVDYAAYFAVQGGRGIAAEGFTQVSDVLEIGLRVLAGVAAPPKATETLAAASAGGQGAAVGLVQATEAAAASPENLREKGYSRNLAWRFSDAETTFEALALNSNAPAAVRAEAYLNWALNTSNTGRFARADVLFDQAAKLAAGDAALEGVMQSYLALHYRNQRKFRDSIAAADKAQQILAQLRGVIGQSTAGSIRKEGGALVIDAELASALRTSGRFSTGSVNLGDRVQVQIAQTLLTQASSYEALGETDKARQQLERAQSILAAPDMASIATFLRVQVAADLARQNQQAGRYEAARLLLTQALTDLRQRESGSPAEAYLTMELARAEALAGDKTRAMRDFQLSIALFRETRGSLGASADSAGAYLDLLLDQSTANPTDAAKDAELFLTAMESLGSQATADTIARLSARLNQKDPTAAGLIRALEDTRQQIRAKEASISLLQGQGAYTPAVRSANDAELKALNLQASDLEQRVANADPRYGQLVASDVKLKDLQSKLKPDELYVKIVLLGGGGYGLAVTSDSATPYRVALNASQGVAAVSNLRKPFETEGRLPRYDVAASYTLFQGLFGPVRDKVLAAKHIIYEPDNAILSLPIAALATDQQSVDLVNRRIADIRAKGEGVLSYSDVNWLGRRAKTSLVVAAASFVQVRSAPASPAAKGFLGFGDSVQASAEDPRAFASVVAFSNVSGADLDLCKATRTALLGLKPLKESRTELEAVGATLNRGGEEIVTGEAFNDGALEQRKDLDQYRVVYFATHGLLPPPGGCLPEPALLTSIGPSDSDGLLDVSKIFGLRLNADLVVLSACDTGGDGVGGDNETASATGAGEALGGLTRAFIYAGARSLLVSHWKIDSKATVRLMTGMFQADQPTQAGSLEASMTAFMDSPNYSHPYYWAAFTLVGDGDRPMPR